MRTSQFGLLTSSFIHSVPDSSPIKRLVLASGYVDYNHLKQKATQAAGDNVTEGIEGKVDL